MAPTEQEIKILDILSSNVHNNPKPNLVNSSLIACQIGISEEDTKKLLRFMQAQGTVEITEDARHSLITSKGLSISLAKEQAVAPVYCQENVHNHYSSLSF